MEFNKVSSQVFARIKLSLWVATQKVDASIQLFDTILLTKRTSGTRILSMLIPCKKPLIIRAGFIFLEDLSHRFVKFTILRFNAGAIFKSFLLKVLKSDS